MDDDKIRDLFGCFEPEISGEREFINRLEVNLRSVEMIKDYNSDIKRRNRIAVIIAAFVGFISGILCTLLFPWMVDSAVTFGSSSVVDSLKNLTEQDYLMIYWIAIAGATAFISFNTYELSLYFLKSSVRKRLPAG